MDSVPRRIGGRYELIAPLGSGGMADVHRARDTVLSRDVALKMLRDTTDVDRERFAAEARILASLDHESLVRVYDAGTDDERPWLALELVEGSPMADLVRQGPVDPLVLAHLTAQVAAGLAHAHERGVVHRDVKPSNVLVTPDGRARLADFGIARLVSSARLTMTGNAIGTAAYLAPEQVRGDPVDGSADVYALGLVLLEALTGRRSYDGPPVEAALARLHHGPLIPTSLPTGWPGLIASMTVSDPAERPSALTVSSRLRELAGHTGAVAATPFVAEPTSSVPIGAVAAAPAAAAAPGRASAASRRRRPLLVAAAAVLVGASLTFVRVADGTPPAPAAAPSSAATSSSAKPARPAPIKVRTSPTPDPTPVVERSGAGEPVPAAPAPERRPSSSSSGGRTTSPSRGAEAGGGSGPKTEPQGSGSKGRAKAKGKSGGGKGGSQGKGGGKSKGR